MKKINKILAVSFLLLLFLMTKEAGASLQTNFSSELSAIEGKLKNPAEVKLVAYLKEGLSFYDSIDDYKAIFHKREANHEGLDATEVIYLKFKKPFKIFMKWFNAGKRGLQVFYERGRHDGKLVIHKPGVLFGLVPLLFLDQNSPWVSQGSVSYDIEDAGIGTFLHDFTKAVIRAANEGKLKVKLGKKSTTRRLNGQEVGVTFLESEKDDDFFAYRVSVFFDDKSSLPIRMALYDWENKLIGIYTYRNLQTNVGEDVEFRNQINPQLLKVYNDKD